MRTTLFAVVLVAACATPKNQERQPSPKAERASTAAVDALIRGDYAAALANAERGLTYDRADPWLLYNRGLALAGLGRLDDALEVLRAAESNFTDHWGKSLAIYRRALALEFAGRCEESSTELARYAALTQAAQPEMANQALTHVRFCLGKTREQVAERDQEAKLIAAEGETIRTQAMEASTEAVRALTLPDYALALKSAEAGLALSPDDPWLLYNKGVALAGLDRTDESLDALRVAERRFGGDSLRGRSVAIYRRAIVLEAVGRCEEEAQELDHYAALVQDPDVKLHAQAHLKFCRLANAAKIF